MRNQECSGVEKSEECERAETVGNDDLRVKCESDILMIMVQEAEMEQNAKNSVPGNAGAPRMDINVGLASSSLPVLPTPILLPFTEISVESQGKMNHNALT